MEKKSNVKLVPVCLSQIMIDQLLHIQRTEGFASRSSTVVSLIQKAYKELLEKQNAQTNISVVD